jgi:DNA (cytosine-5)-methyltransferase 1
MNVLDLFSGIGGFSLGLERAGMRTVQFVEIDPFCQHVLRQHWPDVPVHDDIRSFHAPAGFAEVICGGFPCQDLSFAGKGAGLAGERSGLWSEYARLIGEVRPRFVIVENVSALLARGLGDVLGDLAALGYDAEWHCIPASAVGAPHRRDRVWIVAYPNGGGQQEHGERDGDQAPHTADRDTRRRDPGGLRPNVADAHGSRLEGWFSRRLQERAREWIARARGASGCWQAWESEPDVGRVAHGVPHRVDRLRSLGNAVVPQIPEIIGRAIMAADEATGAT